MKINDKQRQQWIAALTALHGDDVDVEDVHIKADAMLCEVLAAMGEREIVLAWEGVRKWYA